MLEPVCWGILLLYFTVNLYTTSNKKTRFWCSSWKVAHTLPLMCRSYWCLKLLETIILGLDFCRYSTVTVRLHAPNADYNRVNSLPILCYFHFSMCVFVFVFYEVSYTWFWLHIQFCNFLFLCWEESYHLQNNFRNKWFKQVLSV